MRRWLYRLRWRRARRARDVRRAKPIAGRGVEYVWFDDLMNGDHT